MPNFQKLPRHIAIIMDGNGRWAKQRYLSRIFGHRSGVESARVAIEMCVKLKIEVLTLFAFSSENWQRPTEEVNELMELFLTALHNEAPKLHKNNIQLRFIGDSSRFSPELSKCIAENQTLTAKNNGLKLVIAANYGGQWDITNATKTVVEKILAGSLQLDDITPEHFSEHLSTAHLPAPDLFIRTGGEQRISNFLLWQLAYTELYFTKIPWPDFDEAAFETALSFYSQRERRFGITSDQLQQNTNYFAPEK